MTGFFPRAAACALAMAMSVSTMAAPTRFALKPGNGTQPVVDAIGGRAVEARSVTWESTPFGDAIRFDGRKATQGGSVLTLPGSHSDAFLASLGNGPFTIAAWLRFDADFEHSSTREIISAGASYGPGWRLYYTWGSIVFLSGRDKEVDGKPGYMALGTDRLQFPIEPEKWHHLAVVRDTDGVVTIHLDGRPAARSEGPMPVIPAGTPLTIGAYQGGYDYVFKGLIAGLRIDEGAASDADVRLAAFGLGATNTAIELNGMLDDPIWKNAKRYTGFSLHGSGDPAPQQTNVQVTNDADHLYVAITAEEPQMDRLVDRVREHSMKVYRDDCVELMLDVDGSAADYHHLLINPSGFRGQQVRLQTGLIGNRWDSRGWHVAASRDENSWIVELVLPLAALTAEEGGLAPSVRFNVARNRRAGLGDGDGIASSLTHGDFHVPGRFVQYALKNVDVKPMQWRFGEPRVRDSRIVDGRLQVQVEVSVSHAGAQPLELVAQLSTAAGAERFSTTIDPTAASADEPIVLDFTVDQPGAAPLTLVGRAGPRTTYFAEHPLNIDFVPLSVQWESPFYRDAIFATQTIDKAHAEVRVGMSDKDLEDAVIETVLKDDAGKIVAQPATVAAAPRRTITIPVKDLSAARHALHVVVRKAEKVLAETAADLHVLPPAPGSEVRYDERKRLLLNGKPILPVFWHSYTFEGIAETGAHGIIISPLGRPALDKLEQYGLFGVVSLTNGQQHAKYVRGKREFTPEYQQHLKTVVNEVKDHPALFAWMLQDEPEVSGDDPELLKACYQYVRQLDPYHPVFIINDSVAGLHTYAEALDVFVPDPYILTVKGGGLLRDMSYPVAFMREADIAGKGRKLLGHTPQFFSYGDHGQHNGRVPSFIELRCSVYASIIHGARVIDPFHFTHGGKYAEVRIGAPAIIAEINALAPFIVDSHPRPGVQSNEPAVHVAAFDAGNGRTLVIACNIESRARRASITGLPADQVQAVSEGRNLALTGRAFEDDFEPYATHIYLTGETFESGMSLPNVEAAITAENGLFRAQYPSQGSP